MTYTLDARIAESVRAVTEQFAYDTEGSGMYDTSFQFLADLIAPNGDIWHLVNLVETGGGLSFWVMYEPGQVGSYLTTYESVEEALEYSKKRRAR